MSQTLMRSLLIRGSGIQIDDTLRRYGWNGSTPVVSTVLSTEGETGRIKGVRYESRGKGPEIKFSAADLWDGANAEVTVAVTFDDLSKVEWKAEGEFRNQSQWMDESALKVNYTKTTGEGLDIDELDAAGVDGFAIRLTLLPTNVNKLALYGGIVPMSKEELRKKTED